MHNPMLRMGGLALLGIVATAAFPPFDFAALYVLALAGLIHLCGRASPKQAAWGGFVFGFFHFLSGIYWVWISTSRHGGAPIWLGALLLVGLSAYLALYPALAAGLVSYWANRWRQHTVVMALMLWPAVWTLTELARGWVFTGFPWLSAGYLLLDTPLARFAPIGGSYLSSYVVALLAGGLALLAVRDRAARRGAVLVPLLLGAGWYVTPPVMHWNEPVGSTVPAALVQGNVPQDVKWLPESLALTQAHYLELSERAGQSRWIIWPEIAIPGFLEESPAFFDALTRDASTQGATVFVGVLRQQQDQILNSVTAVGRDQPLQGSTYYKRHLVPFGEYFPMPKFLKDFMWQLELRYSDFTPGVDDQALITVDGVPIGVSICFEDAFGREIRRALPQAQVLVTVTNDGWFDDSSAAPQHLQIARMRALENGRELLRVSNRGVSAHIGADGQILDSLEFLRSGVLVTEVQPRQGATPYTSWGEWLVLAGCLSILLGLLSYAVFDTASRRPRPHEHHAE